MKKSLMKKLITVALLAVMICALTVPAFAKDTPDAAAQSFMDVLDDEGIKYTYQGKTDNGEDQITVVYTDDDYNDEEIRLNFFFSAKYPEIYLYVWNILVDVDGDEAIPVLNQLNYDYRYCKFFFDPSDDTITNAMYCYYVDEDDAGDIALCMLQDTLGILDDDEVRESLLSLK